MRFLILFMAESFVTRHIEIGGTLKIITRDLDMAARDIHDSEINKKCPYLRPFLLLKSGIRVYARLASTHFTGEIETFADI
jgi:hypothetical protein